jgi:hypothetical protein
VRLVAQIRFTPLHIVVDDTSARKLQAVGLGDRLVRVHDDVLEFVPLQVLKDFSPIVERRQLDAMIKIDSQLHDAIAAGEMIVEQLSEAESKALEMQLWRDLDRQSRPKRPRKKVARLSLRLTATTGPSPRLRSAARPPRHDSPSCADVDLLNSGKGYSWLVAAIRILRNESSQRSIILS